MLLKKDIRWKRFRSIMKNAWQPTLETNIDEIKTLHAGRSARTLAGKLPTGKRVADASARDIMVRSRCVEIAMDAVVIAELMNSALGAVSKYVETRYSNEMKRMGLTGVNERKAMVTTLLNSYYDKHDEVKTIIKIADMVIADCDKTSFGLRHMVESLAVATRREGL